MKYLYSYIFLLVFFYLQIGSSATALSQSNKSDSLLRLLKNDKRDTLKVAHLTKLGNLYKSQGTYDSAAVFYNEAYLLAQALDFKSGIAENLNHLGLINYMKGNYPEALDLFIKALQISHETGDKNKEAKNLANIGIVYKQQGDFPKALDHYFKSLRIGEETGAQKVILSNLSSIGIVYQLQGEYTKALDYYLKALKIGEALGDKNEIAIDLNNIGIAYHDNGDNAKALEYYFKALKIGEEIDDINIVSGQYTNIGSIYQDEKEYAKALDFYFKALKICEEIGAKDGIALNQSNIGSVYLETKKYKEAEAYLLKALALSDTIGDIYGIMDVNQYLSDLYSETGKLDKALKHYKLAMVAKDTLFNQDKNDAITRKALTYEFDKRTEAAMAEQAKKDLLAAEDQKRQRILTWSVASGLFLAIIFSVFILRSLRETRRQKEEVDRQKAMVEEKNILIEQQKKQVEEKNKEMTDSITYAKRIQYALLASDAYLQKHLSKDYFVVFKPKDIVSGDFYWATRKGGRFYLAVCDSTGHGVPGAFMSLLNIAFLNEAINEKMIEKPGEIFTYVRKRLIQNISRDGGQDGMDGILVCFDIDAKTVSYAAANNAPVIIDHNTLKELPFDKMPIGKGEKLDPFNTFPVLNGEGSMLYLYTDGYADQFGGPSGKKFKYKQLEEKLLAIRQSSLQEQKTDLETTIKKWQGNLEQVDDILLFGIKL